MRTGGFPTEVRWEAIQFTFSRNKVFPFSKNCVIIGWKVDANRHLAVRFPHW